MIRALKAFNAIKDMGLLVRGQDGYLEGGRMFRAIEYIKRRAKRRRVKGGKAFKYRFSDDSRIVFAFPIYWIRQYGGFEVYDKNWNLIEKF